MHVLFCVWLPFLNIRSKTVHAGVSLQFAFPPQPYKDIPRFTYPFDFFKINFLIYLFLVALGLRCCVRAFSSCSKTGLLFVAVCGLLLVVASLVEEHRL